MAIAQSYWLIVQFLLDAEDCHSSWQYSSTLDYLPNVYTCLGFEHCVCVCSCVCVRVCKHAHTRVHVYMCTPRWINGSLVVFSKGLTAFLDCPSKPFSFLNLICYHLKWYVANGICCHSLYQMSYTVIFTTSSASLAHLSWWLQGRKCLLLS